MPSKTILLAGAAALMLSACNKTPEPSASMSPDAMATTDAMGSDAGMASGAASMNPMVGGAEMLPTNPITTNAAAASNLTTLVAAVKQAGLAETLAGPGPFTVFAPTNDAFGKVDKATLDGLMTDAKKPALKKVLTYHVVPGTMTAADLAAKIKAGGGKAMLKTVEGEDLTLSMEGDKIKIAGMGGSSAYVSQADVTQSNGVVHVVDGVLLPSM